MRTDWINTPANNSGLTTPALMNLGFNSLSGETVVSVLSNSGILAITGIDSEKFLQGQLTCNMKDITVQQSRPGAHCNNKGRVIASFRLLQQDVQRYLFLLPQETLAALQKSLGKYIVFSKAKLHEASEDFLLLGIRGPNAAQQVRCVFGNAPTPQHAQCIADNGTVICVDERDPRYLCIIPAEKAESVWRTLTTSCSITGNEYWRWLDIRAGFGDILEQTIEEFIPQQLNLQLLDGISFTKGCYTGQEIVARMQYRGTLKKAMYLIAGNGQAPSPNAGVSQQNTLQAVGHIVMAENIRVDQWEGLAVIAHEATELPLQLAGNEPVSLLALPYAVKPAE